MQPYILFVFFYSMNFMCVNFCYKLILINKFIIHKRVNNSDYDIKYSDLYLSLNVLSFIFIYHQFFILNYSDPITYDTW